MSGWEKVLGWSSQRPAQMLPQLLTHHFPRGLVVSPTQAKWNHSMEHWEREKPKSGTGLVKGGPEEKERPSPAPQDSLLQISREFSYSVSLEKPWQCGGSRYRAPRTTLQWDHLSPPSRLR